MRTHETRKRLESPLKSRCRCEPIGNQRKTAAKKKRGEEGILSVGAKEKFSRVDQVFPIKEKTALYVCYFSCCQAKEEKPLIFLSMQRNFEMISDGKSKELQIAPEK